MGILDSISLSSVKTGIRVVVAGVEGIGKTTLACNAPKALLIPLENGFSGVVVAKTAMLEHFAHVTMLLDEIIQQCAAQQFPYQTLVFDSATALERMIHTAVIDMDPGSANGNKKGVTMTSALGGYGKAYESANDFFEQFLKKCDVLATKYSINIVMTCHVFSSQVLDPSAGEYNSMDILLHSPKNQKTYGKREMLTQWADIVGYLHEPVFVSEGKNMNKGVSANQGRILALNRTPGYVAKNRFGVTNNINLPKEGGWNFLAAEIYTATNGVVDIYNRD